MGGEGDAPHTHQQSSASSACRSGDGDNAEECTIIWDQVPIGGYDGSFPLVELQPKLVLAGKEADELMLKIEVDTKEANVTRANVTKEEAAATKKADEAQAIT